MWDQVDSHSHVFESVKRRHKIKDFNICTCILSSWSTDYTVPHYFVVSEISGVGCDIIWLVNYVPTNGDADSVGVCFLPSEFHHNTRIHHCSISRDAFDFFMGHVVNGLCFLGILVSIGEYAHFNEYRFKPQISQYGIVDELTVTCYGFLCLRVYHAIGYFF